MFALGKMALSVVKMPFYGNPHSSIVVSFPTRNTENSRCPHTIELGGDEVASVRLRHETQLYLQKLLLPKLISKIDTC